MLADEMQQRFETWMANEAAQTVSEMMVRASQSRPFCTTLKSEKATPCGYEVAFSSPILSRAYRRFRF